jgi:hypothetical protein
VVRSIQFFLVSLIATVPVILFIDGLVARGLVAAALSVGTVAFARSARPVDTEFLFASLRWPLLFATIPALWMVIQVLPLKILAHPIWQSTEQALGHSVLGSISIDPGASILALSQYLSALAVLVLTTAVANDRDRSEWLLFALVGTTALVAVVMLCHDSFGFSFLETADDGSEPAQARTCALLGMIFSAAAAIRTYERNETRRHIPSRSASVLMRAFMTSALAFFLCATALASNSTGKTLFAATFGLAPLAAIVLVRRTGLGLWGCLGIATVLALVAFALIATLATINSAEVVLAFASWSPSLATTENMLADAPWLGTGAGTFASLASIYRDAGVHALASPTVAAKIAIELGRPMLWFIVSAMVATVTILLRSALQRGRDSFYPAAGASSLLLVLLLSFCDNGMLGTPSAICLAAITALGLAHTRSRTVVV